MALRVRVIASGPPSCAGCFVVPVLHRIVDASFSMFSFVRRLRAGRREVASFSVMLSVSLSLLESQTLVWPWWSLKFLLGYWKGDLGSFQRSRDR